MDPILERLEGSDRRSIGDADRVAEEIAADAGLFEVVFEAMLSGGPVVRLRAADAVEKATRQHPELLRPYKQRLLHQVAKVDQQEVRWHVAQMLPRLSLDAAELEEALAILEGYLQDESRIVKVNAMQALADLAVYEERLRQRIVPLLEHLTETGSPAMRTRGRMLLERLRRDGTR